MKSHEKGYLDYILITYSSPIDNPGERAFLVYGIATSEVDSMAVPTPPRTDDYYCSVPEIRKSTNVR
jgi:hypothetical protein